MKVKEYLVNRILELERDLKQVRNEKAGTTYGLQKLQEEVIKLNEKIEQYQMEREHIKEIITCNLDASGILYLSDEERDHETLMGLLDIKPEDYDKEYNTDKSAPQRCWGCKYEELEGNLEPCVSCYLGDKKEVTPDAENKD